MDPRAEKMFIHKTAVPGTEVRAGVGVIVRAPDGRIVMEKRSDCGLWGMLGGRIDPGESVVATAVREVREESGLDIEVVGLVGVYSQPSERILVYADNGDIRHIVDIVVEGRIIGGSLQSSHESEDIQFFALDQLPPTSEIVPPAHQPLADYLAGLRGQLK